MLPLENLLLVTDATGIDRIGQDMIDVATINCIAAFDFSRWCGSAFGSQAQTPGFVCNLKDRLVVIDGKLIEKPVLRDMYRIIAVADRTMG